MKKLGQAQDVDVLLKLLNEETVRLEIDKSKFKTHGLVQQAGIIADVACQKEYRIKKISPILFRAETSQKQLWFYRMSNTPVPAYHAARNKNLTKIILKKAGISVPKGSEPLRGLDAAVEYFKHCVHPQVLKPVSGAEGVGVILNIKNKQELTAAVNKIQYLASKDKCKETFVIEDYFEGRDVRIVMVGDKVVSALVREPASVEGDGEKTIKELVEIKNKLRYASVSKPRIKLSKTARNTLAKQGYTSQSILPKGLRVYLDDRGNVSAGADAITILPHVDPSYLEISKSIKNQFPELDYIGIDFLIKDFTKPATKDNYVVIEVNARPALTGSMFPTHGQPVNVASEIFDYWAQKENYNFSNGKYAPEVNYHVNVESYSSKSLNKRLLTEAAYRKGLHVSEFGRYLFQIDCGDDKKKIHFYKGISSLTSSASQFIMNNKSYSKEVLADIGIKTPAWSVFSDDEVEKAYAYASSLESGYVIKPLSSTGGKGVKLNIDNYNDFKDTFLSYESLGFSNALIEEYVSGNDYRILVVGGKICAAAKRLPANVVGDGSHTLQQLIEMKNNERKCNPYLRKNLINIDSEIIYWINKFGYELSSIPSAGEHIRLRGAANVSTGGDCLDVTPIVNSEFGEIVEKIYSALGCPYHLGVDIITEEISEKPSENKYSVIEINASPDLGMHYFPSQGARRDIAGEMLELVFGEDKYKGAVVETGYYELSGLKVASEYLKKLQSEACAHGLTGGISRYEIDRVLFSVIGCRSAVVSFLGKAEKILNSELINLDEEKRRNFHEHLEKINPNKKGFIVYDSFEVEKEKEIRPGLYFSLEGKVQGVGFRRWIKRKSSSFGITGWVRNLENGLLEGLLQGQEHKIEQFLNMCAVGPLKAKVDNIFTGAIAGETFSDFSIKKNEKMPEIDVNELTLYSTGSNAAVRVAKPAVSKEGKRKEIYNYIHALEFEDIPEDDIERAKLLILDAIGLIVLASGDKRTKTVREIGRNLGEREEATILLSGESTSSASAAFISACYMQLHDYNDGHRIATKRKADPHPGRVIIPVALAEAERCQADGKKFLVAIISGYDVAGKIRGSRELRPTCPQYAAAAVAAKLRAFSVPQISSALGYAGYLSASGFGIPSAGAGMDSLSKGFQAYTGILAAQIAETGRAGPKIDFVEKRTLPFLLSEAGSGFEVSRVYVKPYPTCRMTHSAIEALKSAMDDLGITYDDIEKMNVRQLPAGMYVARKKPTQKMSYKKAEFNLYYCLARYAIDRELSVEQFTAEKISDPKLHEFVKKINIESDSTLSQGYPLRRRPAVVELMTKDGRAIERRVDLATGNEKSLSFSLVEEKFMKNCQGVIDKMKAKEIIEEVMNLDKSDSIEKLISLLKSKEYFGTSACHEISLQ